MHWFDLASRQKESKQKTDLTQQAGRKNQSKEHESYSNIHNGRLRKVSKHVHWFDPACRQKESTEKNKQVIQPSTLVDYEKLPSMCTDLTQRAGRKYQKRRTSKLFNPPQRSTTKRFQAGGLIWPSKQAERIKAKEQANYSTIHNGRLRNSSKQVHWFDPVSRQKETKQKNNLVIQPSTTVDYEKLPNRCTNLTRQTSRKKQSKRTSKLFNHQQRLTTKSFQTGALIWPSNQAEWIKAEDWFDPASRQKESKQKNMQVIHPSTMVDYEKLPSRCTDLTRQAGRKNQSRRLFLPSKQAERIKAKEQASYSTIHNGRLRKASKQVHWFDPAGRQKESKQKNKQVIQPSTTVDREKLLSRCTDLTQQAGRKNQSRRLIWPSKQAERIKGEEQASY